MAPAHTPPSVRSTVSGNRYPRVDAVYQFGEALYRIRPDLQAAFPSPRSPEFWYWLMWHGADTYAEIRANLYPLPDPFLRDRVVGEGVSDESFHRSGLVDWQRMEVCLREAGFDFSAGRTVLDFGCGCARILRFFGLYAGSSRFYGADVDPDAIAYSRETIDFASFAQVSLDPPTPFQPGTFDAVFSFSVFSHLPEQRHLRWLEELHRITVPGALLVITTQGEEVIRLILEGSREGLFPPKNLLAPVDASIRAAGFGFFPYEALQPTDARNRSAFEAWDLNAYGATFVLESYVRRSWTVFFDLVAHYPAPDGWQDYVVLRRRA